MATSDSRHLLEGQHWPHRTNSNIKTAHPDNFRFSTVLATIQSNTSNEFEEDQISICRPKQTVGQLYADFSNY